MSQGRNYFEHPAESALTKFARINPILSTLGFLNWAGKLKRTKTPNSSSVKEKAVYKDAEYRDDNGILIAQIRHHKDVPILETYVDGPAGAKARATLLAGYYVEFYFRYLQYLPTAARMVNGKHHPNLQFLPTWLRNIIGPLYMDPLQFIDEEIKHHQFNYSAIYDDLHEIMKEVNLFITKHNQTTPFYLRYPYFTLQSFLHFVVFCDVFKGLGEEGLAGCSTAILPDQSIYSHVDWLALEVLANYLINTLSPVRENIIQNRSTLDGPKSVFTFGIPPGYFGITNCSEKGAIILHEATRQYSMRRKGPHAVPELLLSTQIAEYASSIEEVEVYLRDKKPASSHLLGVALETVVLLIFPCCLMMQGIKSIGFMAIEKEKSQGLLYLLITSLSKTTKKTLLLTLRP